MRDALDNDILFEPHNGNGLRRTAVFADANDAVSPFQHAAAIFLVEGSKGGKVEGKLQRFLFARLQKPRLLKGGKHPIGLIEPALRQRNIRLNDFSARPFADVLHRDGKRDRRTCQRRRAPLNGELGIGKPVTEGEEGLLARRIEIAVPDVDALAVARVVLGVDISHRRIIFVLPPSGSKFARRVALSAQNVGKHIADGTAELRKK